MSDLKLSEKEVDEILSPSAIRDRAAKIFDLTEKGQTAFVYHPEKFKTTVNYVLAVIDKNYPSLDIPFHSRWGHFRAGGIDRVAGLNQELASLEPMERARIKIDLVITSVLLDAGAGMAWSYFESNSQKKFNKSEGLGVASWHLFLSGAMSSDKKSQRADALGLKTITTSKIEQAFQVTSLNPLVGVEGRCTLLNNLSCALENVDIFKNQRPGNIIDYLVKENGNSIPAPKILRAVLDGLGPIWPGRLFARGRNLGDVWKYKKLEDESIVSGLVPFHKLSQWMTYSLIEPIQEAGVKILGISDLTGLAEYRNGGLIVDSGLISLRDPSLAHRRWRPDSDLVIEWRALTVYLLDQIGEAVRIALGKSKEDFPLAKALEGGTWWAGRFIAQEKRKDGSPPLQIESDGTVF